MLGIGEDILSEVAELKGLQRGTLRLGLPRVGSDALFAPIFARFRALYPGIEVELYEAGSAALRDQLHSGELDLAGLLLPVPDEFETQELAREPLLAVLPAGHPLAAQGGEPARTGRAAADPVRFRLCAARDDHPGLPRAAAGPGGGRTHQPDRLHAGTGGGRGGVAFLPAMIARLHAPARHRAGAPGGQRAGMAHGAGMAARCLSGPCRRARWLEASKAP
jgi:DNA-binding transcriptional LysR family regulator